mmetsp:Transcript_9383/g.18272  ORF Transcript_9383/g.18272 Transcript_9383/m.18272 type:complete len:130 (+) Transcript_9383:312-701(+)
MLACTKKGCDTLSSKISTTTTKIIHQHRHRRRRSILLVSPRCFVFLSSESSSSEQSKQWRSDINNSNSSSSSSSNNDCTNGANPRRNLEKSGLRSPRRDQNFVAAGIGRLQDAPDDGEFAKKVSIDGQR